MEHKNQLPGQAIKNIRTKQNNKKAQPQEPLREFDVAFVNHIEKPISPKIISLIAYLQVKEHTGHDIRGNPYIYYTCAGNASANYFVERDEYYWSKSILQANGQYRSTILLGDDAHEKFRLLDDMFQKQEHTKQRLRALLQKQKRQEQHTQWKRKMRGPETQTFTK